MATHNRQNEKKKKKKPEIAHRTVVLPKFRVNSQTAEVSFWQHSLWTGIQVSSIYAV